SKTNNPPHRRTLCGRPRRFRQNPQSASADIAPEPQVLSPARLPGSEFLPSVYARDIGIRKSGLKLRDGVICYRIAPRFSVWIVVFAGIGVLHHPARDQSQFRTLGALHRMRYFAIAIRREPPNTADIPRAAHRRQVFSIYLNRPLRHRSPQRPALD